MDRPLTDRRGHDRRLGPCVTGRLRPATPVVLHDLARGGARVFVNRALPSGGRVHLQLAAADRTLYLTASVQRCFVHALPAHGPVVFGAALVFDQELDPVWVATTPRG